MLLLLNNFHVYTGDWWASCVTNIYLLIIIYTSQSFHGQYDTFDLLDRVFLYKKNQGQAGPIETVISEYMYEYSVRRSLKSVIMYIHDERIEQVGEWNK